MASFQAKIGQKMQRKGQNKNCRSVPFRSYWTHNRKFQSNSKKIQKILKIPLRLHFKPKQVGKYREKEKIKIVISFRSVPTRRILENSKKISKKFKNLKNTIMASFQANIDWKRTRK